MKIKMTPELAEICGIHAGDGYMRDDGHRREIEISGGLDEIEYYDNHVSPLFEKVFNIKIKPKYFLTKGTYGIVKYGKTEIIETLHALGFPYGKKTLTVSVPKQILVSKNLDIIYSFIRGVFDTDGCLNFEKKHGKGYSVFHKTRHFYPRILFSCCSKQLVDGLEKLLEKTAFRFNRSVLIPKSKKDNLSYRLALQGKDNLFSWMNNISFKNPSKYSRFLIWKKYGFCPPNTTYVQRKAILNKDICPHSFY